MILNGMDADGVIKARTITISCGSTCQSKPRGASQNIKRRENKKMLPSQETETSIK